MYLIQGISDAALQQQTLILPTGGAVVITLKYVPMQYGWFFTSIVYQDFTITNYRVCNSPNMLFQFRNLLPFGIACFATGDREPTQQEDFIDEYASLYVLSADDVIQYTRFLSDGV